MDAMTRMLMISFANGQIYGHIPPRERIPLDQLSTANPQLFYQIENDAKLHIQRHFDRDSGPGLVHGHLPHQSRETVRVPAASTSVTSSKDHLKAFIAETVVSINMNQAQNVNSKLGDWSEFLTISQEQRDPDLGAVRMASMQVQRRLSNLLSTAFENPPLPALLFGNSTLI